MRGSEDNIGSGRGSKGIRGPASSAIGYLLNYLSESSKILGYIPPTNPDVRAIVDEGGMSGHALTLPAPRNGFTGHQRDSIEAYAKTLTYWRKLLVEVQWGAKDVSITFVRPETAPEEEAEQKAQNLTLREKLRGRSYRATRIMGQVLVDHSFMVREPVQVSLLTFDNRYNGYAIMLKYPVSSVKDLAGIVNAYDSWIPLLCDSIGRSLDLKSEYHKDGAITTAFFTQDKRYTSSLFETSKSFRIFVPRLRTRVDPIFFTKATYRACRALAQRYKKDFNIAKKPLPSWGVTGHSLVMNYKKGAAGKLVDDSYLYHVRLMSEKLMKKFHLQASIKHHSDTKSLVVSFYSGSGDRWMTSSRYSEGVAIIEHSESERPAETVL